MVFWRPFETDENNVASDIISENVETVEYDEFKNKDLHCSRIVYEKAFMMNLRNSPCSKTPPSYDIPERVLKSSSNIKKNGFKKSDTTNSYLNNPKDKNHSKGSEEDQFQLEL
ncbi:hypothetical protein NQ318_017301 [Aromia moschata]|uniref:Uncharacterized protein n=1 Tax=Aromia moschata TaxID=1265417 RepID=A0AAV8XVY8_9CUCU|nr:hypothetical protein NQ318_017301 [Aromia moschata]